MGDMFGYQFYACGKEGLPESLKIDTYVYGLTEIFKKDFFAETALYTLSGSIGRADVPQKVILKVGRKEHFFGIPLQWLGEYICEHELNIMRRVSHIENTPRLLLRYGRTGFIYQYIEGRTLSQVTELPENYFDELYALIEKVHDQNIAYLDMNKKGNILLGDDNRPYLIDFQIAVHIDDDLPLVGKCLRTVKRCLQEADIYHLFKHKKRLCPDKLTEQEQTLAQCGTLIKLHRMIANPFRAVRRNFFNLLYKKNILDAKDKNE